MRLKNIYYLKMHYECQIIWNEVITFARNTLNKSKAIEEFNTCSQKFLPKHLRFLK